MNLRMPKNPWPLMVAVNVAVLIGVFLYKMTLVPYVPYIHLLVDYHFGFTKRALIGAIASLFVHKMPVWPVSAGRLSFRLHQARANRRNRVPVRPQDAGMAGIRARRRDVADHGRLVRSFIPANVRLRPCAATAVRIDCGIAVLPQELHLYVGAFRHLWLRNCDLS